jgi:hypothetical protein
LRRRKKRNPSVHDYPANPFVSRLKTMTQKGEKGNELFLYPRSLERRQGPAMQALIVLALRRCDILGSLQRD